MASKRRQRRRSCEGKVSYATEAAASAACNAARKRDDKPDRVGHLAPYKCDFAHHWHIGHRNKGRKRSVIAKKQNKIKATRTLQPPLDTKAEKE